MKVIERHPGLPIASEVALVYIIAHSRGSTDQSAVDKYRSMFEEMANRREDVEATLLRRIMFDGPSGKNLARVEKYLYG
jgi:hypothetical protein